MRRVPLFSILGLMLVMLTSACMTSGMNRPSSSPERMSSDTLCYRAAGAKKDEAITDEIHARGLDCRALLESDPLLRGRY